MKIIKEGDLKRLDSTRRFECSACGCVWEANASEYRKEWDRNDTLIACECPTCKKTSHTSAKTSARDGSGRIVAAG